MAKKAAVAPAQISHAQSMGMAAGAAMAHLRATGMQTINADPTSYNAMLNEEGPPATTQTGYAQKPSGK